MFDFIRTHQRLAQALLLVLILPAFVFFGISGYDQMFGHGDAVASVEGEPVPRAYFDNTYRQQVQQMQQMLGDNFDAAVYDSPAMRAEVLENIITQQAMLVDARKNRITVARPEIQRAILQRHQDLRTDKGQFDIEAYQRLLAANQMTAAQYEASISQQLALGPWSAPCANRPWCRRRWWTVWWPRWRTGAWCAPCCCPRRTTKRA